MVVVEEKQAGRAMHKMVVRLVERDCTKCAVAARA